MERTTRCGVGRAIAVGLIQGDKKSVVPSGKGLLSGKQNQYRADDRTVSQGLAWQAGCLGWRSRELTQRFSMVWDLARASPSPVMPPCRAVASAPARHMSQPGQGIPQGMRGAGELLQA